MMKRLHILQHVAHEGPGAIAVAAEENGCTLTYTRLFNGDSFPALDQFDALAIMGGPMGVYDDLPWLKAEQQFIKAVIDAGKPVLGVCLGAQLIAAVAGAQVYPHTHREIGWWPIGLTASGSNSTLLEGFPASQQVLHWHGDTFDLPEEAVLLASSEACQHQAFSLKDGRVLGLQFHFEVDEEMVQQFADFDAAVLKEGGDWVQSSDQILSEAGKHIPACRNLMKTLVARWLNLV